MTSPLRSFRLGDEWAELKAEAPDGNRNKILRDLIRWYLGKPDAELPTPPRFDRQLPPCHICGDTFTRPGDDPPICRSCCELD